MPEPQLLPADLAEDSLESLLSSHGRPGSPVYLAVVALLAAALGLLPVVRVGVSVRSPGVVRPGTERHEVLAPTSGVAEVVGVREGEPVEAGTLLVRLRPEPFDARARLVASELARLEAERRDLVLLATSRTPGALPPEAVRTPRLRGELLQLAGELGEIGVREESAGRDLARAAALAARGVLAPLEVEERASALARLRAERALRLARARGGWQDALAGGEARARELRARADELGREAALLRVASPLAGTVEELAAISPGSWVQAGSRLALISPRAPLLAEVYVAPRDVGLLREGMPARLEVDAFPSGDWGVLAGRVAEIADDFSLLGDRPVFRVRVALESTHLALRGGARGELRKGMTLRARFMVAERTLLQLLRDDVQDWISPGPGA